MSLQEIIRRSPGDVRFAATRGWIELQECVFEVLVDLHDGCLVAAAVAVVGGAENSHDVLVVRPVVALDISYYG